jgi:hypothetical protein
MDVSVAGYYIFNEKGNKGSQMGHTKKIFKKFEIKNTFKKLSFFTSSPAIPTISPTTPKTTSGENMVR